MKSIYSDQQRLRTDLKLERNEAFEHLYRRSYRAIEKMVMSNSGSQDEAKDIFQDGVIGLLKLIRKPEFELKAHITTLMYSICRNLWLKKLRDSRGKEFKILDDEEQNIVAVDLESEIDPLEEDGKFEALRDQLDSIGDICKKVILYFYYQKLSHKEIAELMGYTAGYVRVRLCRCMNSLRKAMKNDPRIEL